MARFPLLLRVIVCGCVLCLPSTAFAPGAITAACAQNHRRGGCRGSDHEQPRHDPSAQTVERRHRRSRHSRNTELRAAEGGGGASNRGGFLKRVAAGTFAGCAAGVAVGPEEAGAFCGEPYPYWAYFMDFDEVFVPFNYEGYSGKLFARTVGNSKEQKKAQHNPLVIIPGGPGLPHDYLETLEGAAKDDRLVVLFDPIGTGNSTALPADVLAKSPDLLGTSSLVEQTKAVLDYFRVNTFHLLGHGTGAGAALELGRSVGKASPRPPGPELEAVLSVTLASPVLGDDELSPDFFDTLRAPYTKGGNEPPICLETAMEGRNADGFSGGLAAMKQDRRSKRGTAAVGPLACPVLITYGKRDVIGESAIDGIKEGLSGGESPVEVKRFDGGGHLAHLDEREAYVALVQNYVTSIDDAWVGKKTETKK